MSTESSGVQRKDQDCFHCGQVIPPKSDFIVRIDDQDRLFCCAGCQAVAQAIVDNHLADYYRYRTSPATTARTLVPEELQQISLYDHPTLQRQFVAADAECKHTNLIIEGIVCAACVWLLEKHVATLPGVAEFRVNYSTRRAHLAWDETRSKLSEILQAITRIGYLAHPLDAKRQEMVYLRERRRALRRLAVAGLGSMQVMMLAVALYAGDYSGIDSDLAIFFRWLSLFIATPVVLYSAWPFYLAAWRDLRLGRLGMDVPVAFSVAVVYLAGIWAILSQQGEIYFDSITMFVFFLLSGRYLEMQARHRAGQAADEMVKLIPAMATQVDRDGRDQVIAVTQLRPGDTVRVKPGETIPVDGTVIVGVSHVDESILTGESVPLNKRQGESVIGGSHNIDSPLVIRVDKVGQDTVLAAIQRLLERAQSEKPDLAKLADRVASHFVAGLFIIALVVGALWWQFDPKQAFWVIIGILVVTCPCALSLATPTALIAATGRLMQLGILTTRGHALETLARVTHVVFDKTGTLSKGQLQLTGIEALGPLNKQRCIEIAVALERHSEHPLARSLIRQLPDTELTAADVIATVGQGLEGSVAGKRYRIGRADYAAPEDVALPRETQHTCIVLADHHQILAVFHFQDSLRDDAAAAVAELHRQGITVLLYSGDHLDVVNRVAGQIGIREYRGGMTPEDKFQSVQALQGNGAVVAMIGDGVNDAPVLAAAQVSLAMGKAAPLAQASADMVLLSERLLHVPMAVAMARQTHNVIRQNLLWALLYNLTVLPLAALGLITPWMAGIGMSASSLVVVFNALRLSRFATTRGNASGTVDLTRARMEY